MIIAVKNNSIIAYVSYKIINEKKGWLIGAGVDSNYRKKGIATKILKKAIIDLIKGGVKRIDSRTWESNIPSIKLHEKLGFSKYKTIKNDRVNGESTVCFKL